MNDPMAYDLDQPQRQAFAAGLSPVWGGLGEATERVPIGPSRSSR